MVSCRGCLVGTPPAPLRNIASTSLRACACVCTACVPRWHPSGAFEYTRRRHLSRHRATDTDWRANDTLRTLHSARANLTQARQPPLSESARFRPTKPDNEGISLYCAQDYNPISGPTSSTNQSSDKIRLLGFTHYTTRILRNSAMPLSYFATFIVYFPWRAIRSHYILNPDLPDRTWTFAAFP